MKGFYIEVSNELLDPKHCQNMGDSVWLFLWFLDKMTVIDHDAGEGKVLGGKPIKFEDVKDDLGISRSTYVRWLKKLREEPYIKVERTTYGQSVIVLKAKKRFGRTTKFDKAEESDVSKMEHLEKADVPQVEHLTPPSRHISSSKMTHVHKTVSVDSISKTDSEQSSHDENLDLINPFIELFEPINPNFSELFKRKPQRDALLRMIKRFGAEKVENMLRSLPGIVSQKYAPTITTPVQLENKLGELILFMKKGTGNGKEKTIIGLKEMQTV